MEQIGERIVHFRKEASNYGIHNPWGCFKKNREPLEKKTNKAAIFAADDYTGAMHFYVIPLKLILYECSL